MNTYKISDFNARLLGMFFNLMLERAGEKPEDVVIKAIRFAQQILKLGYKEVAPIQLDNQLTHFTHFLMEVRRKGEVRVEHDDKEVIEFFDLFVDAGLMYKGYNPYYEQGACFTYRKEETQK